MLELRYHLKQAAQQNAWLPGLEPLLAEIAAATVEIAEAVRRGAMQQSLVGSSNQKNVHGEEVQKLDTWANAVLRERLERSGYVQAMASEEEEHAIIVRDQDSGGRFLVMFDPLDGSSNIDVNATIGTIFSIHHRYELAANNEDLQLPGTLQIAAGYATYGSSTMFVYTARNGVHGFTFQPSTGQLVQTHSEIRCPPQGAIYSINEGNRESWSTAHRDLISWYQQKDITSRRPFSARYIGSLVADFHRTLLKGGIFLYPSDAKNPSGKLRYLYEAAPLALVCEQAGGEASNGVRRILDIHPESLHQRTPLLIGSRDLVTHAVQFLDESVLGEPSKRG